MDVTTTQHTCNPLRPGEALPLGMPGRPGECPRCDHMRALVDAALTDTRQEK